ncbi:efflux RND transporter periplasmic adaptor subunit [Lichenicoccus roseus]|uniref:Efflux RND transporter periplasmic adaptor subunit n=1 Tax=Lichenicoccus roseus TaxID=2683649 RepID=A0A5R9J0S2_9PROT|nr:efflux RND transporter periplasmic adaptor subunit [Lichenicoccus roseus]TLU71122.1 efflux RND transporter periplasmic adaptor subunit [Lichenicoccus roseus]
MRSFLLAMALALTAIVSLARADDQPRRPLFYQDPDGKPFYASGPKKTSAGRDYQPIFDGAAQQPVTPVAATSPAPAKPPGSNHRILYYRNPMGLPDTSPKPKNDSMGMAYIPVYADERSQEDPPGTVRMTPGRLQTLGVRTEAAEMRPPASRTIRAIGTLQFDERRLATVTTRVPGWIEHLAVAANGDPVRRGQMLAEIYSPDMVASEEEYLIAARMGGAIARASLQRLRALDIPDDEIARLRRSSRSTRRIPVVAQADGVVIDKPVQEGMRVDAGEALYRTADLSSLWLIAQVQEQDLGAIVPGQVARATFIAFPGRGFEGRVEFVYPSLSADTRTVRVRIVLPNRDGNLRAAMFANVQIEAAPAGAPVVTVPDSAVLDSGTRQVVLVVAGGGRFQPRTVSLGIHGDGWVQVTDGVKPGERVVVGANFLIDAESNLRTALQGFGSVDTPQAGQSGAKP